MVLKAQQGRCVSFQRRHLLTKHILMQTSAIAAGDNVEAVGGRNPRYATGNVSGPTRVFAPGSRTLESSKSPGTLGRLGRDSKTKTFSSVLPPPCG